MRKFTAAVIAAVLLVQTAAPVMARDLFNSSTMLGWRQQTDTAVMAYFRTPLGPKTPTSAALPRMGVMLAAPRSYSAGEAALHMQGQRLLDFSLSKQGPQKAWVGTLHAGPTVAWTSDPRTLSKEQQAHLLGMSSGASWLVVGALTVAAGVGIFALTEQD